MSSIGYSSISTKNINGDEADIAVRQILDSKSIDDNKLENMFDMSIRENGALNADTEKKCQEDTKERPPPPASPSPPPHIQRGVGVGHKQIKNPVDEDAESLAVSIFFFIQITRKCNCLFFLLQKSLSPQSPDPDDNNTCIEEEDDNYSDSQERPLSEDEVKYTKNKANLYLKLYLLFSIF